MKLDVTWDTINKGTNVQLSNSDLTATIPNNRNTVRASKGKTSGKWYWEIRVDSMSQTGGAMIGVVNSDAKLSVVNHNTQNVRYIFSHNGTLYPGIIAYGERYGVGDVISVAVDLDKDTITFYVNGVSLGVSPRSIKELGEIFPAVSSGGGAISNTVTANFGATPFEYDVPEGYRPYRYNPTNKTFILNEGKYKKYEKPFFSDNQIPLMTSDTAPLGESSASSNRSTVTPPWRAFDGSSTTNWRSNNATVNKEWLAYEFSSKIAIESYKLSVHQNPQLAPKKWSFEASNNGVDWIVLDYIEEELLSIALEKEYFFRNATEYKMYRINIEDIKTPSVAITELEMRSKLGGDNWETVSNSLPTLSQFESEGVEDLSVFEREERAVLDSPQSMFSESLGEGRVFKSTVNLKKYFDLRKLEIK